MTRERWQRIEQIYHGALECLPGQRDAYVESNCSGDETLLREVQSLLEAAGGSGEFMEELPRGLVAGALGDDPVDSMVGRSLGRYEILSPLGSGGMGRVYLARDIDLGRKVAVKVLRERLMLDREQVRRFRQEAQSTSALNHPNIITVFEIGAADGLNFIAAEFVDGETLDRVLARGPLNVREVLSIATQVAEALVAAHGAGVIHRDIKLANIMLRRDQYVKVLDFGIAKLMDPEGEQVRTRTGLVPGTRRYMSPEQVLGQQLDGRTDIFSLGVVLYELASGRGPFDGPTPGDLSALIRSTEAQPLKSVVDNVPSELDRIVSKALAKDRDERYRTARELLSDLNELKLSLDIQSARAAPALPKATHHVPMPRRRLLIASLLAVPALLMAATGLSFWFGRGEKAQPSIAILPLKDLSAEQNQEYLCEGLTDELVTWLAKIRGLRVAGTTSTSIFKRKPSDPKTIERELHVASYLEGSVRGLQGGQVRVNVRLIRTADGFPLWSDNLDGQVSDVLRIADRIGRKITASMKVDVAERKTEPQRLNTEAYNAFRQGVHFLSQGGVEKAKEYLERSISLDPGYAPAWAALGETRSFLAGSQRIPPVEGYRLAREAVERALSLDPNLPDAYAVRAEIQIFHDWDWAGAKVSSGRALELEPGDAGIMSVAASLARVLGQFDEAIGLYRRLIDADPLHTNAYKNLGLTLYGVGSYEEAAAQINKAFEQVPTMLFGHFYLTHISLMQAQPQQALAEAQKERHPGLRLAGLALAFHALRDKAQSDAMLAQLVANHGKEAPYQIAEVYAFRGETEQAFAWLERASALHDDSLPEIKGDQILKRLRSDPRYAALLRKMRLPL